jgi:hypothetical protein
MVRPGEFFFVRFDRFFERYRELNDEPGDADFVNAGGEEMDRFGHLATAYNLANKNILEVESVLSLPAVFVYEILLLNLYERRIQKNLSRIFENKSKSSK